jgi:predicted Zn finger-like uncharacterized protein
MKFVCERCHTRYSIADDKVRQKILKIRCKTCENVITVRDPSSAAPEPPVSAAQPPPPPPPRQPTPPPSAVREWFVAINGDQTGPATRTEAARRVSEARPEDEVYVWKEGLDGWKAPHEVPPIQHELNMLRSRSALPPRAPVAAPPRSVAPAPARAASPSHAGARAAPAAASLAEANPFGDEDHTQIQPFDAGLLAPDRVNNPAAVLPFNKGGRTTNGKAAAVASARPAAAAPAPAPTPASNNLDGLFADIPPASAGPNAFVPAPASLHAPARADSGLSKLTGVAGFMSRNPGLKFVAAGAVVVVLLALVVIVIVMSPNEQKQPPPPLAVTPPPAEKVAPPPDEAEAKRAADDRFHATVPSQRNVGASIGPARGERVDRKKPKPSAQPRAVTPPATLEPPSMGAAGTEPAGATQQRRVASDERQVPKFQSNRQSAAEAGGGGPTEQQINAVVKKRENQMTIKTCYERALKRDDRMRSGRIETSVTIGTSGMPKAVNLNAPPEFASVESCIKQAVRRWAFPPNSEEYKTEFTLIMAGNE